MKRPQSKYIRILVSDAKWIVRAQRKLCSIINPQLHNKPEQGLEPGPEKNSEQRLEHGDGTVGKVRYNKVSEEVSITMNDEIPTRKNEEIGITNNNMRRLDENNLFGITTVLNSNISDSTIFAGNSQNQDEQIKIKEVKFTSVKKQELENETGNVKDYVSFQAYDDMDYNKADTPADDCPFNEKNYQANWALSRDNLINHNNNKQYEGKNLNSKAKRKAKYRKCTVAKNLLEKHCEPKFKKNMIRKDRQRHPVMRRRHSSGGESAQMEGIHVSYRQFCEKMKFRDFVYSTLPRRIKKKHNKQTINKTQHIDQSEIVKEEPNQKNYTDHNYVNLQVHNHSDITENLEYQENYSFAEKNSSTYGYTHFDELDNKYSQNIGQKSSFDPSNVTAHVDYQRSYSDSQYEQVDISELSPFIPQSCIAKVTDLTLSDLDTRDGNYNTVPRSRRTRIKTNPWLPSPRTSPDSSVVTSPMTSSLESTTPLSSGYPEISMSGSVGQNYVEFTFARQSCSSLSDPMTSPCDQATFSPSSSMDESGFSSTHETAGRSRSISTDSDEHHITMDSCRSAATKNSYSEALYRSIDSGHVENYCEYYEELDQEVGDNWVELTEGSTDMLYSDEDIISSDAIHDSCNFEETDQEEQSFNYEDIFEEQLEQSLSLEEGEGHSYSIVGSQEDIFDVFTSNDNLDDTSGDVNDIVSMETSMGIDWDSQCSADQEVYCYTKNDDVIDHYMCTGNNNVINTCSERFNTTNFVKDDVLDDEKDVVFGNKSSHACADYHHKGVDKYHNNKPTHSRSNTGLYHLYEDDLCDSDDTLKPQHKKQLTRYLNTVEGVIPNAYIAESQTGYNVYSREDLRLQDMEETNHIHGHERVYDYGSSTIENKSASSPSKLQSLRGSLKEKVQRLKQDKWAVDALVRRSRQEDRLQRQELARIQAQGTLARREILLRTLSDLRGKLDTQTDRLQAAYEGVIGHQYRALLAERTRVV